MDGWMDGRTDEGAPPSPSAARTTRHRLHHHGPSALATQAQCRPRATHLTPPHAPTHPNQGIDRSIGQSGPTHDN